MPVNKGEFLISDRGYMIAERLAAVIAAGADSIVRSGWRRVRWLDDKGDRFDLLAALANAGDTNQIDRTIGIGRKSGPALTMRLIAIRKPPEAAAVSRDKARREASKEKAAISDGTLIAADWVLLVTTLTEDQFSVNEVADMYRTRCRIKLAFKCLKSLIGLGGPPGQDAQVAKTWVLAHLLMILLLEPHISAPEVSRRRAPVRRAA